MIGIHVVHRRMAELHEKATQAGGYENLSKSDFIELEHCLKVNAKIVQKLDELKQLSFIAYQSGDMEWVQEISARIDQIESTLI